MNALVEFSNIAVGLVLCLGTVVMAGCIVCCIYFGAEEHGPDRDRDHNY